ncbi:MAG: carbohydrate porin [Myxococcales bacterium]|nr:carbohydrate porin [Myxococcales bacterium]
MARTSLRTLVFVAPFMATTLVQLSSFAQPASPPADTKPKPSDDSRVLPVDHPPAAPPPADRAAPADDSRVMPVGQKAPAQGGLSSPAPSPYLPPPASGHEGHFEFGSYGRVWAATDLQGRMGRGSNVVAFGPRLVDEGSYAELELRREDTWSEKTKGRVVATMALFPPFFHFSGNPANAIGVRNLYAQGTYDKVNLWAGSRMYRGDDIYLLNWWPLDNQNTVGGGAFGSFDSKAGKTILAVHMGQQRLDNTYQAQQIPVVAPFGFGTVNITKLDRPRMVETLKITQLFKNGPEARFFADDNQGFKVSLYGEAHQLSSGVFQDPLTQRDRDLPSDGGFLVGSQLTYFTGHRDTHVHLFLRHARGIAAYDPLEAPATFTLDRSTQGASDTRIAFSGNVEQGPFAVAWGAYVRFFRDASTDQSTTQKYDEGAIVARPSFFLGEHFGLSLEGSYQMRRIKVIDPSTDAPLTAQVGRFGIMPYFSPSGRGTFKRPQIRLIYALTGRDSGAKRLYAAEDIVGQRGVDHFLGLGAEWWFNSSSYP